MSQPKAPSKSENPHAAPDDEPIIPMNAPSSPPDVKDSDTAAADTLQQHKTRVPNRPTPIDGNEWRQSLDSYLSISRLVRAHAEQSLGQTSGRLRNSASRTMMEAEARRLNDEKLRRLGSLAKVPVATFSDFTLKLEILFDEIFQHDPSYGGFIGELVADARSLHRSARTEGR